MQYRIENNREKRITAMSKITIEFGDLVAALENNSNEHAPYLDLKTGTVIRTVADRFSESIEDTDQIHSMIEQEPYRYLAITPMGSAERYAIIEQFVDHIQDARLKEQLKTPLMKKKPFRTFNDAINNYPEIREKWRAFHDGELTRRSLDWLEENGIDAELANAASAG